MKKFLFFFKLIFFIFFVFDTPANAFNDLQPLIINENTPIIFTETKNFLVYEEKDSKIKIHDFIKNSSVFINSNSINEINSQNYYWIAQKLKNELQNEIQIRIDSSGWAKSDSYIIFNDKKIKKLKSSGFLRANFNHLAHINPFIPGSSQVESQFPIITLKKDQEISLITRVKSSNNLPAKSFNLSFFDHTKFLEVRRYGIYIEGILLGILSALGIFGCFSAYTNKDKAQYIYSIWILIAFFQVFSMFTNDGARALELATNIEGMKFLHTYLSYPTVIFFSYGQAIGYAVFAATFLNIKKYFPLLNKYIYFYVIFYSAHFFFFTFIDHNLSPLYVWMPNGIITFFLLCSFFVAAYIRYQNGHSVAKFMMIALVPYIFFRSIFILGLIGVSSPFTLLDPTGIGLLLHDSRTAQAMGLGCEAMIMALAVITRSKWLQLQLTNNLEKQNKLIENQNRLLETTVAERTVELASQHQKLNDSHQLIISSVNYASRLQRGQLPKMNRTEGRFHSIASIWQPRDTIGGDLWWISSKTSKKIFSLAITDCTGHGVPGAMLSLLVSNSLERIHSENMQIDPANALMLLDSMVRVGLNQDNIESESDDGCDAAIIQINKIEKKVIYAGAKISLFHFNDANMAKRYKPSKASLGYQKPSEKKDEPFNIAINYQIGDVFIMLTDGFTDQIGKKDAKNKSYGYKKIEKILNNLKKENAEEIKNILWNDFLLWQGEELRRDDVTAVIIKM